MSNSRIYLFGTKYKNECWFDILNTNELSGMIANMLKVSMPELEFKNIQFINDYKKGVFNSEVHINKLKYNSKRIIPKNEFKKLYKKLSEQFKKINNFEYSKMDIVNDEFSKQPSNSFLSEEPFYV